MLRATTIVSKVALPKKVNAVISRPISTKPSLPIFAQPKTQINTVVKSVQPIAISRSFAEQQDRPQRNNRRFNQNRNQTPREPKEPREIKASSTWLKINLGKQAPETNEISSAISEAGIQLGPSGVVNVKTPKGQPLGLMVAEFASQEDATRVLKELRIPGASFRDITAEAKDEMLSQANKDSTVAVIKNVPFSATVSEVKDLFPGVDIPDANVVVAHGAAYVKFNTVEERDNALQTQGYDRYSRITLFPAVDAQMQELKANPSRVIKVRGSPVGVRYSDYREFFSGLNITSIRTIWKVDQDGTQIPDNVFIEFSTPEEATQALEKSGHYMGERFLRLMISSPTERRRQHQRQLAQQQEQQE